MDQGVVKNPNDGRLRQNRRFGLKVERRTDVVPGAKGRIRDPSTDRRLKQNRSRADRSG